MKNVFEKVFLLKGSNYCDMLESGLTGFFIGKIKVLSWDKYDPMLYEIDDYNLTECDLLGNIFLKASFGPSHCIESGFEFFSAKFPNRIFVRSICKTEDSKIEYGPLKQIILQTHETVMPEGLPFEVAGDHKWWNILTSYFKDLLLLPYDSEDDSPFCLVNIGPLSQDWDQVIWGNNCVVE